MRAIALLLFMISFAFAKIEWETGATVGDPMPFAPQIGLHIHHIGLRLAPGFWYEEDRTFWAGASTGASYALVQRKWYSLEAGAAFHYYYAQAKDEMAITVNEALGQRVMYDVQWVQWMSAGPQFTVKLFGLFAQFSVPVWQSGEIQRNLEWRAGFVF